MSRFCSLQGVVMAIVLSTLCNAQDANELAKQGHAFLKKYCHECHGGATEEEPGLLVLDRETLVAPSTGKKPPYIVPGKPEASFLWMRTVKDKSMPPPDGEAELPSDEQRKLFELWIAKGAIFPTDTSRTFVSDSAILGVVRDHLRSIPSEDRVYQRYFTLVHLHNDLQVTDQQLCLYRAALSKLANSLSWQREIVLPKPLDAQQLVLRIDLREFGWHDKDTWKLIIKGYPYGVLHSEEAELNDLEREVAELAKSKFAVLRADWFVTSCSRPPKYDALLALPGSLKELERNRLKVDLERNFLSDNLVRAGFNASKVSKHNRLVERHATPFGAYWRSYDFASSAGRGNLTRFPLGPAFSGHPFPDQTFQYAGGEVIFNLPNGLQGYMLADAKDKILSEPAPITIVRDLRETAGTPEVVNGISCMACHKHGVVKFKDAIRSDPAVFGDAKRKVNRLFPPQQNMDEILRRDEERFMRAVEDACGSFVKVGEDQDKPIRLFEEPIASVARLYFKDLAPTSVAAELGFPDVKSLEDAVRGNPRFIELGLGPVLQGEPIKRELWEAPGLSLFHQVIAELKLTPNLPL